MDSSALTASRPLTVTLHGTTHTGILWHHPSGRGAFLVGYKASEKSDGCRHYKSLDHIEAQARILLAELVREQLPE